jgi:hypothetical protein
VNDTVSLKKNELYKFSNNYMGLKLSLQLGFVSTSSMEIGVLSSNEA